MFHLPELPVNPVNSTPFMAKHEEAMVNNNMNRRKSKVIERETALGDLLENYNNLSYEEQIESVIETAYEIGNLGRMKIAETQLERSLTLENSFVQNWNKSHIYNPEIFRKIWKFYRKYVINRKERHI